MKILLYVAVFVAAGIPFAGCATVGATATPAVEVLGATNAPTEDGVGGDASQADASYRQLLAAAGIDTTGGFFFDAEMDAKSTTVHATGANINLGADEEVVEGVGEAVSAINAALTSYLGPERAAPLLVSEEEPVTVNEKTLKVARQLFDLGLIGIDVLGVIGENVTANSEPKPQTAQELMPFVDFDGLMDAKSTTVHAIGSVINLPKNSFTTAPDGGDDNEKEE